VPEINGIRRSVARLVADPNLVSARQQQDEELIDLAPGSHPASLALRLVSVAWTAVAVARATTNVL